MKIILYLSLFTLTISCTPSMEDVHKKVSDDFVKFLELVAKGLVYLDPALKVELNEKGKEEVKTRYQFRIRKKDATYLYQLFQNVDL